jgi:hypothetical protein
MATVIKIPVLRKLTRDSGPIPSLRDLLERSGFKIRGRNRADCVHCEGGSRGVVSFNSDVWHCFRCGRAGNTRTLARALGLALPPVAEEIFKRREREEEFCEWLDILHERLASVWRELGQQAEIAKQILAHWPDEELAWEALADFYHSQADFEAAFEFLSCEKVPRYLEQPMTRAKLFAAFEEAVARVGASDVA